MKHIISLAAITVSSMLVSGTFAQNAASAVTTARERAQIRKAAKFGGILQRPNAHPGKFAFVNAQNRVAESNLLETVMFLRRMTHANIVLEGGRAVTAATAGTARKEAKADVAVFLVEDKTMPDMMLISPEGKWGMVNIAALIVDGAAQPFVVARLNKEMARAFAYVAGGCGSEFKGNLMDHIQRPDQLDSYTEAHPPMDVLAKISHRLPQLGVTPQRITTYQQACREGWAPAPTNDVQKAIWDKVHAVPKNPMTIEFDPKKGK